MTDRQKGPLGPYVKQAAQEVVISNDKFYRAWDAWVQKRKDACSTLFVYLTRTNQRVINIGTTLSQNIQFRTPVEEDWFNEGAAYFACKSMTMNEKKLVLKRILFAQAYENPNYSVNEAKILVTAFDMDYSFLDCVTWPGPLYDVLVTYIAFRQTEVFRGLQTESFFKQTGEEILTWLMLTFVETTNKPITALAAEYATNNILKYLKYIPKDKSNEIFTKKLKFLRTTRPELFPSEKPCLLEIILVVNGMIKETISDVDLTVTTSFSSATPTIVNMIKKLVPPSEPKKK